MVGNRAWSEEATQGRVCTKWRPLNEESVYLIRDGERKREGVRRGERGRETKRGTFSCVWRIRERGEHFKRFEGKQKWKKDRMKGGPGRGRAKEGNNVHLWFVWKSSKRWEHLGWHIFTVQRAVVCSPCPFVFHFRFRRLAFHGPPESFHRMNPRLFDFEPHQPS